MHELCILFRDRIKNSTIIAKRDIQLRILVKIPTRCARQKLVHSDSLNECSSNKEYAIIKNDLFTQIYTCHHIYMIPNIEIT
jgi:hypothetical protein